MKNVPGSILFGAAAALAALAALAGCGAAQAVSAATACDTLIVAIGEARQLAPERAVADIRTVGAVCGRLQSTDTADGGAQ